MYTALDWAGLHTGITSSADITLTADKATRLPYYALYEPAKLACALECISIEWTRYVIAGGDPVTMAWNTDALLAEIDGLIESALCDGETLTLAAQIASDMYAMECAFIRATA